MGERQRRSPSERFRGTESAPACLAARPLVQAGASYLDSVVFELPAAQSALLLSVLFQAFFARTALFQSGLLQSCVVRLLLRYFALRATTFDTFMASP